MSHQDTEELVFKEPIEGGEAGELWHDRVRTALDWRKSRWNGDDAWKRAIELNKGIHWQWGGKDEDDDQLSSDAPRERVTVNVVGATVRDFMAFLLKHTPKFLVKARTKEEIRSAKRQQSLLNYFWREKGWMKQVRRCVRDYLVVGHAVAHTGWKLELNESLNPNEDGLIDYHDAVRKDEPIVRRVNPFRFIIDPQAPDQDIESARWVAEILYMPLHDVIVNNRYDEKVRRDLRHKKHTVPVVKQADFMTDTLEDNEDSVLDEPRSADKGTDIVRLFMVWDKKYQRYYVLLENVDEPLLAKDWPYEYLDGFPYVMAVFDELNDDMYGVGIPHIVEDQQHELNRIRTTAYQHRRHYGSRKWQVLENAIEQSELGKLRSSDGVEIITVRTKDAISAVEVPELPKDNYAVEGSIKGDIRQLTGSDQLTQGGDLPSRTSATEIQARTQYTGAKIDMQVSSVDNFIGSISRQILQHMKEHLTVKQSVRIDGAQGQEWLYVRRSDIQAETDIEVHTTAASRVDETTERQEAIQVVDRILQALPLLAQTGYRVNVGELLKWALGEKLGVKEVDRFIEAAPPQPPQGAGGGQAEGAPGPVGISPLQQAAQRRGARAESAMRGEMMGGR